MLHLKTHLTYSYENISDALYNSGANLRVDAVFSPQGDECAVRMKRNYSIGHDGKSKNKF